MPISSQKQSKQSNNLLSIHWVPTASAHLSLTINTQSGIFYH